MLFSGEAREAYLDSFLSGFLLGAPAGVAKALLPEGDSGNPKKTQGKDTPDQTGQPKTDPQPVQPGTTIPEGERKPTTASHPGDAPRRVWLTEPDVKPEATTEDPKPQITETLPQEQPRTADPSQPRTQPDRAADSGTQPEIPYFTPDIRTNELDGMWTEADADLWTQSDAETQQKPLRHEDQPRPYPDGDTSPSANPEVLTASSPKSGPVADMAVVPQSREQIISELAPKITKPGTTPGRATIEAQRMYTEIENRYGQGAQTVLEMYQPGQDPRKFLDGFRNAYLSGKMGSRAALENSTAAAYLTEEQKTFAYEMGENSGAYAIKKVQQGRLVYKDGVLGASGNIGEKAKPYSQRGIQIEHRLKSYLKKLQRNGDYITVPNGEIRNRDLAVLTTETGVEFTRVNAAGKTFLIRGSENFTTIPQEILDLVINSRGAIECHSHPYIGDLVPSDADKRMMELLTWLNESSIIDPTERIARFNALGLIDTGMEANERDTNYYKDMIWGEE